MSTAVCTALEVGVMRGALYALTGRFRMSIGVPSRGASPLAFTQRYVLGAPAPAEAWPVADTPAAALPAVGTR
ncbi:MAG: hypothetical protein ABW178_10580 [Pseudoxanthomonas sp.]